MTLAQRLYENGHITYMRTDSTNVSGLALNAASKYIDDNYGQTTKKPDNIRPKTAPPKKPTKLLGQQILTL